LYVICAGFSFGDEAAQHTSCTLNSSLSMPAFNKTYALNIRFACALPASALSQQIKDDLVDAASAKAAAEAAQRGNMLMNALWSIVGGGKQVRRCAQHSLHSTHHTAPAACYKHIL
jgi:hypothetical protein